MYLHMLSSCRQRRSRAHQGLYASCHREGDRWCSFVRSVYGYYRGLLLTLPDSQCIMSILCWPWWGECGKLFSKTDTQLLFANSSPKSIKATSQSILIGQLVHWRELEWTYWKTSFDHYNDTNEVLFLDGRANEKNRACAYERFLIRHCIYCSTRIRHHDIRPNLITWMSIENILPIKASTTLDFSLFNTQSVSLLVYLPLKCRIFFTQK